MIADIGLPELYRGKANLWVEDALTRVCLREYWSNDPDFFFLTAGRNFSVHAAARDAHERGYINVFGVVDRDFEISNRPNWNNPAAGIHCFVLHAHEFENLLLDSQALAGCTNNNLHRSAVDIDARLIARAHQLSWWMACRSIVAQIRQDFTNGFLKHPKIPEVVDLASARDAIVSQPWFQTVHGKSTILQNPAEITNRLNTSHPTMQQMLANGDWQTNYSGKELFHHVRGWIYAPPVAVSPTDADIDLGRSVIQWQVNNNQIPQQIIDLRNAVRARAGLP